MLLSVGLLPVLNDLLCFWIEEQASRLPEALHREALHKEEAAHTAALRYAHASRPLLPCTWVGLF